LSALSACELHAEQVRDILQLLDYELTDNPADANIIWAWRDPFSKALIDPEETVLMAAHEQLTKLGNQQYVNQVFGSGYLTTKGELAALSQQLPFLPKTFKLPQQYTAWQEFIKTGGGADMEWIQKSTGHRGISIIADPLASSWASIKQEVLVQQLIRPYLISNRVWDVGKPRCQAMGPTQWREESDISQPYATHAAFC
jgi:hypothetical protein